MSTFVPVSRVDKERGKVSSSRGWGEVTEGTHREMLIHILEEKHQKHQLDKELRKDGARGTMEGVSSPRWGETVVPSTRRTQGRARFAG